MKKFGKYTLVEKIGAGGMAEIWRASLSGADGFEKQVVIKQILPQYARSRSFITMFVQEAKVASHIQHPNVVQIYELGQESGQYFIAMEYVPGHDLLAILERASHLRRHIPIELCLFIAGEVCKGLEEAHHATDAKGQLLNIIHRDVSPANILVSRDGDVKLTDFGVARASVEGKTIGVTGQLQGKLGYMSPEQVASQTTDFRSDLFSLGIVLFECITHQRLFIGTNDIATLAKVRNADIDSSLSAHPNLPAPVVSILRKALAKTPKDRYRSAQAMEEEIGQYLFDNRLRVTRRALGSFVSELFETPVDIIELAPLEIGSDVVLDTDSDNDSTWSISERTVPSSPSAGAGLEKSTFRFRSSMGQEFGPVTYPNLLNLLRSHSVSPDEMISINDKDWRPLGEVSSLSHLVNDVYELESEREPTQQGVFGIESVARILSELAVRNATGRLQVKSEDRRKEVFFRRGYVVSVLSNLKNELFGSLLRERAIVSEDVLLNAMKQARDHGWPLGHALVQMGHIQQLELFQLLDEQFQDKVHQLFEWQDAAFAFFEGDEPEGDAIPFRLETHRAITEAVRKTVSLEILQGLYGSTMGHFVTPVDNRPFDITQLCLNSREYRYRNIIEGQSETISVILQLNTKSTEEQTSLLRVLYLLDQTGHVQVHPTK
jgi:serine/threonine protein kinase